MCATQRTTGACAQCYERAVKKWIALAVLVVTGAIVAAVMLTRDQAPPRAVDDPVVNDFRSVERQCITTFNNALRQQRANEIDEVELAVAIERDVLALADLVAELDVVGIQRVVRLLGDLLVADPGAGLLVELMEVDGVIA